MNWKQQTVLVTGAGGFIGSHLAEHLTKLGAKTRALVRYNSSSAAGWLDHSTLRREMDVRFGDIRDPDALRRSMQGVDVVFHLAALIGIPYSYEAPLSYVRTNVEGTVNVLQLARELGIKRVIQTSTSEVYGNAPEFPITEQTPLRGQSPYSASKIASDQLALSYYCSFELPVVVLRPFNTYGPRQSARAIIPTIVSQALLRDEIQIGSLTPSRDLTHVADTCAGFVAAAESEKAVGQTIQLGTGRDHSVGDLINTILRLLGKEMPVKQSSERIRPAASEIDRLLSSPEKAREMLGWEPKISLEEGLQSVIDWMRGNLGAYQNSGYIV
jgi:NAD dependent epimerase/dehydratase